MKRTNHAEKNHGKQIAVTTMTLCGLVFLPGCPGFNLSDLSDLVDRFGGSNGTDACAFRNDGECDDGRPGSATSLCPFGTDSEDCDGTGGSTPPPSTATNVTGTWRISEVDSSNCDDSGATRTITWDVTQAGNGVTILSVERDIVLTGTITGNTINLQGSFPDGGGTTTITSTDITIGTTGDTVTGTESWFWTGPSGSCSGTTSLTGSRN